MLVLRGCDTSPVYGERQAFKKRSLPLSMDQNDERATACVAGDEISVFYWCEVSDSYLSDKKRAGIPQLLSHEVGGIK